MEAKCHKQTDDGRVVYITCKPTTCGGEIFYVNVGRDMVSQCTKYEVSSFTRYEAMNGSAKRRKWGGLRWLRGHLRSW